MMRTAASLLLLAASASAAGPENGGKPFAPDQPAAANDIAFLCDYRKLALEFAKKALPSHDARLTFDALMLGSLCNETRPEAAPQPQPTLGEVATACSIYVAVDGDDSHAGTTTASAKKTIAAGIEATRALTAAKTLCVGAGTFYLDAPLDLTAQDSGLAIHGEPNATWLSGAKRLPGS